MTKSSSIDNPVVLITGGAKRIGADIARHLHNYHFNIVIHYHHSKSDAEQLVALLNNIRANSTISLQANLISIDAIATLAQQAIAHWGKLDVLINNASSFYPTIIGETSENDWEDIIGSNVKAPFFLAQALAAELTRNNGCIINIADIYAEKPLKQHSVYSMAKAANVMLTKTLALELAPHVRVNGVAPGAILWPENGNKENSEKLSPEDKQNLIRKIPLQKNGEATDIAKTILFLIKDAPYINGQIIAVDGGRNLTI